MANNDSGPADRSLGKQHALLRHAITPLERNLTAGAPAALVLLALKNLRYLSAVHERDEHEALQFRGEYASFENLHRGLGTLWSDFMSSLESALDAPGATIGEDQISAGRRLISGLADHWCEEEQIFAAEFQQKIKDKHAEGIAPNPALP